MYETNANPYVSAFAWMNQDNETPRRMSTMLREQREVVRELSNEVAQIRRELKDAKFRLERAQRDLRKLELMADGTTPSSREAQPEPDMSGFVADPDDLVL